MWIYMISSFLQLSSATMQDSLLTEHAVPKILKEGYYFEGLISLPLLARVIIFIVCTIVALTFLSLSICSIPLLLIGNVKSFVFKYTLGNIFLLIGFLMIMNPYKESDSSVLSYEHILFICYIICVTLNIIACLFFTSFFFILFVIILQFVFSFLYIIHRFPWIRAALTHTSEP